MTVELSADQVDLLIAMAGGKICRNRPRFVSVDSRRHRSADLYVLRAARLARSELEFNHVSHSRVNYVLTEAGEQLARQYLQSRSTTPEAGPG